MNGMGNLEKSDVLFDKTLEYIREIRDPGILRMITDKKTFVKTVYAHSELCKQLTVEAEISIDLGNAKGDIVKQIMTPVQFGGFGNAVINRNINKINIYGKRWVKDQLTLSNTPYETPQKICKMSFPLCSTTPDFCFFSGLSDCTKETPIYFNQGAITGVGKVFTLKLDADHNWMKLIKSTPLLTNKAPQLPYRLKYHTELCNRIATHAKSATRWSIWHFKHELQDRIDFDYKDESIELFSTDFGRQLLCEAMSVLDYVDNATKELDIKVFFPFVISKKRTGPVFEQNFLTAYSINCTTTLNIDDLKKLDIVTNNHLADAMYSVALSQFLI